MPEKLQKCIYPDSVRQYLGASICEDCSYKDICVQYTKPEKPTIDFKTDEPKKKLYTFSSHGIEFVDIPAGSFPMGENDTHNDERPVHNVNITKRFSMSKYPITQAQYKHAMDENPSHYKMDTAPVTDISWNTAMKFCAQLKQLDYLQDAEHVYSLPTEAQWEYACRAGTITPRFFQGKASDYMWYERNYRGDDCPRIVGQLLPNAWGLYDMLGNVHEWCLDVYRSSFYSSYPNLDNPVCVAVDGGKNEYRVLRGGCWTTSLSNCRCAKRFMAVTNTESRQIGFRVVINYD